MWEYGVVEADSNPQVHWVLKTSGPPIEEKEMLTLLNRAGKDGWEVILENERGKYLLKRRISK